MVNGCLKSDFISNVFPGFCSSMNSQCLRLLVNILKIVLCWYPGSLHELFCRFFSKYNQYFMFYPLWTSCCLLTCREETSLHELVTPKRAVLIWLGWVCSDELVFSCGWMWKFYRLWTVHCMYITRNMLDSKDIDHYKSCWILSHHTNTYAIFWSHLESSFGWELK